MPRQVCSFWLRPAEAPEGVPLSTIQPVWTLPVERAVAVPELPAFPPHARSPARTAIVRPWTLAWGAGQGTLCPGLQT